MPVVTVIIATWNRGELLLPTLRSALAQRFKDFEVIIVGDGCTDNTAAVVAPFLGKKVRWINLNHNTGSQSFPNNVGIAMARGQYITYLGHDDIWDLNHLEVLQNVFAHAPDCHFAVSGGLVHGPPDSNYETVTGLFDDSFSAPAEHFFPPTALMHRRDCVKRIGFWRSPMRLHAPVDHDFQLRAVAAGMRFNSTGIVTAHKFAAGHRYLFYMAPTASEQSEMLHKLARPDRSWVDEAVERAHQNNRFMLLRHLDFKNFPPGKLSRENLLNRGIVLPPLQALNGPVVVDQTAEPRGLDWQALNPGGYRWSGPNPRPKILLPYTSKTPVLMAIGIFAMSETARKQLTIRVNRKAVSFQIQSMGGGHFSIEFRAELKPDNYSVLEFDAWPGPFNGQICALAIGKLVLVQMIVKGFKNGQPIYGLPPM
jgi:glycosyltransferase involved in cell wall biosynthesis